MECSLGLLNGKTACVKTAANGEMICAGRKPKCAFPCSSQGWVFVVATRGLEQDREVILYYLMLLQGARKGSPQEKGFLPGWENVEGAIWYCQLSGSFSVWIICCAFCYWCRNCFLISLLFSVICCYQNPWSFSFVPPVGGGWENFTGEYHS